MKISLLGYILLRKNDYEYLCRNTDELRRLQEQIRLHTLDTIARENASKEHFEKLLDLNKKLESKEITYKEYDEQFRKESSFYNELLMKHKRTD